MSMSVVDSTISDPVMGSGPEDRSPGQPQQGPSSTFPHFFPRTARSTCRPRSASERSGLLSHRPHRGACDTSLAVAQIRCLRATVAYLPSNPRNPCTIAFSYLGLETGSLMLHGGFEMPTGAQPTSALVSAS